MAELHFVPASIQHDPAEPAADSLSLATDYELPSLRFERRGYPRKKLEQNLVATYELPDGRKFRDIDELKQLLLANKDPLARPITEKLLVYATGRGLRFSDRPAIDAIVGASRDDGYGLRRLIHRIVESPTFLAAEPKR